MFKPEVLQQRMVRQPVQRFTRYPIHGPIIHGFRAHAPVKGDAGFVPVQATPFQAAAASFHGQRGQAPEQGLSLIHI